MCRLNASSSWCVVGLMLAGAGSSLADPIGLLTQDQTRPEAAAAGLRTCHVFAVFSNPTDYLHGTIYTEIATDAPNGFYQDQIGSNLPPNNAFCEFFPLLCSDSFVTVGTTVPNSSLIILPDFDSAAFNPPPPQNMCIGEWAAFDFSGLGTPDENLKVLIAQFTVEAGYSVAGSLGLVHGEGTIYYPTSFECFAEPITPCQVDLALCKDGDDCTADVCFPPGVGADENGCLYFDLAANCQDDNVCTVDACDPASGCIFSPAVAGTPCGSPTNTSCTNPDACDGAGSCQSNHEPDGTPCPQDASECTVDVCAAGACTHQPLPMGTPCASDNNQCTQDFCGGGAACVHGFLPTGSPCGDPTMTDCNAPDTCSAFGVCQPNLAPLGTACAPDANPCTPDVCVNGTCTHGPDCPADLDHDGTVGPTDLSVLLGAWGPNPGHPADLDCNGTVDPTDLAQVLGNWGPCE